MVAGNAASAVVRCTKDLAHGRDGVCFCLGFASLGGSGACVLSRMFTGLLVGSWSRRHQSGHGPRFDSSGSGKRLIAPA